MFSSIRVRDTEIYKELFTKKNRCCILNSKLLIVLEHQRRKFIGEHD